MFSSCELIIITNYEIQNWKFILKIVSMIRKYYKHKLQTNLWHHKEESHNKHETPGRQTKQSHQFSLPHQDDCKTRMDIKGGGGGTGTKSAVVVVQKMFSSHGGLLTIANVSSWRNTLIKLKHYDETKKRAQGPRTSK